MKIFLVPYFFNLSAFVIIVNAREVYGEGFKNASK